MGRKRIDEKNSNRIGKYHTKNNASGLECLNCTLPVNVCVGDPKRCVKAYEKIRKLK